MSIEKAVVAGDPPIGQKASYILATDASIFSQVLSIIY